MSRLPRVTGNCPPPLAVVEVTVSSEIRPQEPLLVVIEMTLHQLLWNKLSLGGGRATCKSVNGE